LAHREPEGRRGNELAHQAARPRPRGRDPERRGEGREGEDPHAPAVVRRRELGHDAREGPGRVAHRRGRVGERGRLDRAVVRVGSGPEARMKRTLAALLTAALAAPALAQDAGDVPDLFRAPPRFKGRDRAKAGDWLARPTRT